ncbi:ABC transporter ATP-binding protein [bacterium]|nr:MAG: ABC transporter ATP-binding protein [bacterium]
MSTAIKVENLSKAYQLGTIGTGTLSRDLERWIARVRGKEDPFMTIGEANDRSVKGSSDVVLSLNNISFDIQQGDAVGIIGRNGAGKSTLLKLLSRVTSPTTGTIKVKGRIASLLEVGTGFHPELTGRENIFLNGAILGMRKREIARKFDQIVDFAGVERYIDTPVKRYSSGMYVRLAFAVAAHLESEILIVDEVLAVGDAEFQKKCLGKMGEVSQGEGRTVLFVSHNMGSIKALCNNVIILHNGTLNYQGDLHTGIEKYVSINSKTPSSIYNFTSVDSNKSYFNHLKVVDNDGKQRSEFRFDEQIFLECNLKVLKEHLGAKISAQVIDKSERIVFTSEVGVSDFNSRDNFKNNLNLLINIPSNVLVPNVYKIKFTLHIPNVEYLDLLQDVLEFTILETGTDFHMYGNSDYGCVFVDCKWTDKSSELTVFQHI